MFYRVRGNKYGEIGILECESEKEAIVRFKNIMTEKKRGKEYYEEDFYTLERITNTKNNGQLKRAKTIAKEYTNMI